MENLLTDITSSASLVMGLLAFFISMLLSFIALVIHCTIELIARRREAKKCQDQK